MDTFFGLPLPLFRPYLPYPPHPPRVPTRKNRESRASTAAPTRREAREPPQSWAPQPRRGSPPSLPATR